MADFTLTAEDIKALAQAVNGTPSFEDPRIDYVEIQVYEADRAIARRILDNPDALRAYLDGAERAAEVRVAAGRLLHALTSDALIPPEIERLRAALAGTEGPSE